ncbi:hypothetical protein [Agrobacterium vitis]|uniref:hypothetical protein n=1 Tax=Agrobacterium vitis TaxID=373 RepID=UPI00114D1AC2|nr:hypothetical protein [Agrobacterium vitis]MUO72943.1 hypothetical protein [Agrobacterium vitis]
MNRDDELEKLRTELKISQAMCNSFEEAALRYRSEGYELAKRLADEITELRTALRKYEGTRDEHLNMFQLKHDDVVKIIEVKEPSERFSNLLGTIVSVDINGKSFGLIQKIDKATGRASPKLIGRFEGMVFELVNRPNAQQAVN